jgi:hypothetical protein
MNNEYAQSMKSPLSPIQHPGPYGVAGLPVQRKRRGAGWRPIPILTALVAVFIWGAAVGRYLTVKAMKLTPTSTPKVPALDFHSEVA